mmetsp:Transcript_17604/g.42968  ORF Transcript_17604/g.42968 Transcript_17604/m.42968 type:complete len:211 (-) Transcript_17604:161-793(-)|eukprot:CAMPEP_0114522822 /NCGR_PEP_ID=MMETSP0109-20121206/20951_1 /TAXON_ID=29199 /ORGANISM="Chlorarachnion reptans, Strain CCCM449" /LENGTH=210 /DNA_ID=CAMNT_0001704073 /DNA_START=21 /DNA_END=653 /DNA_ORIENTATION=-
MFSLTKRLKEAVALTNKLDQKRFPKVLGRVIQKQGDQSGKIFTEEEEEQLSSILGLEKSELDKVLSLSKYVFEQAAYNNASGSNLLENLQKAGMSQEPAEAYSRVWHEQRRVLVKKLQQFTLGAPKVLVDTDWRFNLKMSSQAFEKEKELKSVVRFSLGDATLLTPGSEDEESKKNGVEDICLELGKDGLVDLYNKLETIQTQIDALIKN